MVYKKTVGQKNMFLHEGGVLKIIFKRYKDAKCKNYIRKLIYALKAKS